MVVSFDPHPREVVHGEAVQLLTTLEERAEKLETLGLEGFVVLPFTPTFAQLTPRAFIEEVLVRRIGLQEIVVGYDHGFGRGFGQLLGVAPRLTVSASPHLCIPVSPCPRVPASPCLFCLPMVP